MDANLKNAINEVIKEEEEKKKKVKQDKPNKVKSKDDKVKPNKKKEDDKDNTAETDDKVKTDKDNNVEKKDDKVKPTPDSEKPPKNFNLLKTIKKNELYGKSSGRDKKARDILESKCERSNKQKIFPGQLVMFQYFNPKTKEQLEYYDAFPVTIFFGQFNSQEGKRYLGFNIHYYPPQLRYHIMHKIFEIYRPVYMKCWNDVDTELNAFDYQYLIDQLVKAKLDFGVRMYIPTLCGIPRCIPPKYWEYAVFTEGVFKKQTRAQIMKYWKAKSASATKK